MEVAVNWLAVILVMVASVVIGFAWYGPLFGKLWMKEMNFTMPEGEKPSMTKPIVISLIGALLLGYVLTHSLAFGNAYLGMSGVGSGMMGAFWNWLGFVVPVMFSFVAWEGKSWKLFAIQAGYWLVLFLVAGAIIAGMN